MFRVIQYKDKRLLKYCLKFSCISTIISYKSVDKNLFWTQNNQLIDGMVGMEKTESLGASLKTLESLVGD